MTTETAAKDRISPVVRRAGEGPRLPVWVPWLLALFFAAGALRCLNQAVITDTDAARHAMNGAFLYDMVRLGHLTQPTVYAKEYYGHFPALSLPFHPPGFPAIEAVFFAIFGVKVLSSRLAVALAVGICAFLLYQLIRATWGNDVLAACVTVATLSTWLSGYVSTDVMLEFPALAFALAALLCLRNLDRVYTMRRALLFAFFAAAAVWTKQQTAFLLGVPLLLAILGRRWSLLREKPFWISSAIVAIAIAGVTFAWSIFRGFDMPDANMVGTTPHALGFIFIRNLGVYGDWMVANLLWLPAIFALCAVLVYAWAVFRGCRKKLGGRLPAAWILSVAGLLMVLGAASPRYLFWLLPAVIGLVYAMLFRGSSYLWGERWASCLAAGFALAWLVHGLSFQPEYLHGPAEAAALVTRDQVPSRIIYAGEADGNFTFAVRTHDPKLQTAIIPGGKFPQDVFAPAALEQFCRDYGINWIVIEDTSIAHKWSDLLKNPPSTMQLVTSIPMTSSRVRWRTGAVRIFRFTAPSDHPRNLLSIPIRKLGRSIEVRM